MCSKEYKASTEGWLLFWQCHGQCQHTSFHLILKKLWLFKVLKITMFWDVMPCSLVNRKQNFRAIYCLHFPEKSLPISLALILLTWRRRQHSSHMLATNYHTLFQKFPTWPHHMGIDTRNGRQQCVTTQMSSGGLNQFQLNNDPRVLKADWRSACQMHTVVHSTFPVMDRGQRCTSFSYFDSGWVTDAYIWSRNEMSKWRITLPKITMDSLLLWQTCAGLYSSTSNFRQWYILR
jgi:hypothetical protein